MNLFTKFLARRMGKRFYNYAYCWGACLVILGAGFKIMHLPYDNLMLLVGLGVEVFIFFISGFEEPPREYKWERVFPELDKGKSAITPVPPTGGSVVCAEKMRRMEQNIDLLNSVYEMHVEGIRKQTEMIRDLNGNLANLKDVYEKTIEDNRSFSSETEKMTKQVNALNRQYSRVLDAMNVKTEN